MTDWHLLSSDEALREAASSTDGLTTQEARRRLVEHGPNELVQKAAKSRWRILLEQFTSLLIVILIIAAAVSAALGDLEDAIAIVAIVVLNALLGFRQEYRAEKTMAALRRLAAPTVRLRRDGRLTEVPASEVVVGDVIAVEAGALVPADARVFHSASLRAQESALTGESEPVEKVSEPVAGQDVPLADRLNMLYLGTSVAYGRGEAVVTATGMQTELGKIAGMIQGVEQERTPLQKRLGQLGRWLAAAALILVAIIFLQGLLRDQGARVMFLTAVSMAVAAVPEGLPAIVTISLSLGAQRMLRRHALIRKLPAVETLGSVTVICSDKTGTLTENRMTVAILDVAGDEVDMHQAMKHGECASLESAEIVEVVRLISEKPAIGLITAAAALCNDSTLVTSNLGADPDCSTTELRAIGDPTEGALVVAAARLGMAKPALEKAFPRVQEIPFESDRKLMTTVHGLPTVPMEGLEELSAFLAAEDAGHVGFTKGALDSVMPAARAIWDRGEVSPLDPEARERIERANDQLAGAGHAGARGRLPASRRRRSSRRHGRMGAGPHPHWARRHDRPPTHRSPRGGPDRPRGRHTAGDDNRRPAPHRRKHSHPGRHPGRAAGGWGNARLNGTHRCGSRPPLPRGALCRGRADLALRAGGSRAEAEDRRGSATSRPDRGDDR